MIIYQDLPVGFYDDNLTVNDWGCIIQFQELSQKTIEKFGNKIHWELLAYWQELSEKFIIKHQDKLSWNAISECQKLSEEFIFKFKDEINFYLLKQNPRCPENIKTINDII